MYSVRPRRASTGLKSKVPRIACDSGGPQRASRGPQEETSTYSVRFGRASTNLKRASSRPQEDEKHEVLHIASNSVHRTPS